MVRVAKEHKNWTDQHGREVQLGDAVKVNGERGNYTFKSAWVLDDGTVDSIWVHGGPSARTMNRAFRPEKVTLLTGKKGRAS